MTNSLYEIPLVRNDGSAASLADYRGQVLLVVNVASACGLTPQYAALEHLYETYRDQGFQVLAFPCNDFGAQEPGSNEEIAEFCTSRFAVQFPLFDKITVKGEAAHPLYQALRAAAPLPLVKEDSGRLKSRLDLAALETPAAIAWNFEKFLVGRDGKVIARFAPDFAPDDAAIISAVTTALSA